MGLWRSAKGMVRIQVISADLSGFLSDAAEMGIVIHDVQFIDLLTLTASVDRESFSACWCLAEKRGETFRLLGQQGLYWHIKRLLFRPVLLTAILLLVIAVITIPKHIFFIRVEGNSTVADRYILEQAETCGINFGASRALVRSEKVKNALVDRIPQLQWVGITTKGCVATITVREKADTESAESKSSGVGSIVAGQSGIISQITAVRGSLACKVGQAVKKGQVLISGYTDCGLSVQITQAEGEIYAQTLRTLITETMSEVESRVNISKKRTRYSLKIGKNLIKLYKGSGISPGSCVKMYSEKNITLPGGFQLPVSLMKEELVLYETSNLSLAEENVTWLETAAHNYLNSQMIAGQVLEETTEISALDGRLLLKGQYTCHEMIGVLKNEEIILPDGESD